jgi:hypothetical protein
MDTKDTILVLSVFIICGIIVGYAVVYQSTPISTISMNITILEKYPVHSYQVQGGGGKAAGVKCTYTDPPKIVNEKGDLYIVENEDDWAKMQVNKTYNVQYASYPNAQRGEIVGIEP